MNSSSGSARAIPTAGIDWKVKTLLSCSLQRDESRTVNSLTGLGTSPSFRQTLEAVARLSIHQHAPLSVVTLDVDSLKAYNQAFGHSAGDEVLRAIADLLMTNVESVERVARRGGEEFTIILIDRDAGAAVRTAEHLEEPYRRTIGFLPR